MNSSHVIYVWVQVSVHSLLTGDNNMACKANKNLQQSILRSPPLNTTSVCQEISWSHTWLDYPHVFFYYLWDKSVHLPTSLTVLCLSWRAGLISFNVSAENRPTFQCTHPLTDKEAAPLLPVNAADSDTPLWRLSSTERLVPAWQARTLCLTIPKLSVTNLPFDNETEFKETFVAGLSRK